MVHREVAHDAGLYLDGLHIHLPFHLIAGLQLLAVHHLGTLEHADRRVVEVVLEDDGTRFFHIQSTPGCLLDPFVGVAIAVEANGLAGLDVFLQCHQDSAYLALTLGYPIADVMGDEVKFTDGKISSKTGIQGDVTVYQISVPIQPGNSGGPLFDDKGCLVGITSSGLNRDYFKAENVNYAIKSSYLKALVDAMPQPVRLQTNADIANKPLTEKIKLFQGYMTYIKVK